MTYVGWPNGALVPAAGDERLDVDTLTRKPLPVSGAGGGDTTLLAKEVTLLAVLAQLDDVTADTVLSVLKAILVAIAAAPDQVDVIDRMARLLGHVIVDSSALPAGAASETTLASRASEATLASFLAAFNAEDFASQPTLAAVLAELNQKLEAGETVGAAQVGAWTVTANLGTIDGVATESTLATRLTDAQLRAIPVPVSGPLTDGQLRATPVPVSFPPDEAGLTNAELRATPVPVSGPLTDTQLRASPVPVSGTVTANLGTIDGAATEVTVGRRFAPGMRTTRALEVSGAGNNLLVDPSPGKKVRLYWLGLATSQDNASATLAVARFVGAADDLYRWPMGNPGAFMHWEPVDGPVDADLVLNLSAAQSVQVNLTYEEI